MHTQNPNVKPSARFSLLGVIDPDAYAANTYTTGWVNAGNHESLLAIIKVGELGASATVDAKLEQASSSGGAGAKDISGKTITQLTKAGSDDDKQAMINCLAEELDINNGFEYVRLSVTVAVATSDMDAVLLAFDSRYLPAHASTVDEVVG